MITITTDLLTSIEDFKKILAQYYEGKIDNLKPYTAIMGIYKEGPKETYMVRPRIAGGVTRIEQLQGLHEIAKKYNLEMRLTTRQDIQLHSVKVTELGAVLDELVTCDLITKGAGGDGVRNVACSPLSGVAQDEAFDVTPYVKGVTNFMVQNPDSFKLGRKFKIAFSNSPEDTANASISDIGFIAKIQDGKQGFAVYGGGGLGGNAQPAVPLANFIAAGEALYYAEAMRQLFAREGDRTNRAKARLRFVVQRLGQEAFVNLFRSELEKVKVENLDVSDLSGLERVDPITTQNDENKDYSWDVVYKNIIIPQKQAGYYSLYVHPRNGLLKNDEFEQMARFLGALPYPTSIRLTMTQGFFIRDLKKDEVDALLKMISNFSSPFDLENSVACVGPAICNFGINNPHKLLNSILEKMKDQSETIKSVLPRILISGCPNSCGQHQKGLIGFSGRKRRTENGLIETYSLSMGGSVGADGARLGKVYGEISTEKIADFVLQLANLAIATNHSSFGDFIEKEEQQIKELVAEYSV